MAVVRVSIQPAIHQNVLNGDLKLNPSPEGARSHPYQAYVSSGFICKLSHAPEELAKTVTAESLKDFQWYFEQYAVNEPFSHARAQVIWRRLQSQGRQLLETYLLPEIQPSIERPEHFLIEVRATEDGQLSKAPTLHRFFWEILEDKSIWRDVLQIEPMSVTVVRVYEKKALLESKDNPRPADFTSKPNKTNVLAITARPSHTKDAPDQLTIRSIFAVIDSVQDRSASQVTLEIVRPGSFEALGHHLHQFPPGHFRVVHLDLPGDTGGKG